MLIGGSVDQHQEKFILRSFREYSGGPKARITILPSGSSLDEAGTEYQEVFEDFGVEWVKVLPLFSHDDASSQEMARDIANSTGIFLTGGDQSKIVRILKGTPALEAIWNAYETRGAVIAGTSAGAAALSSPMIASGSKGSLPRSAMAKLSDGLGFTRYLLIDQHFHQRDRLGRLIAASMSYPHMLGVGVDEDTAAIVTPDDRLQVIGRGTVTIVDACQALSFNPNTTPSGSPLAFSELTLHMLIPGGEFDLNKRTIIPKETHDENRRKPGFSRT